MPGVGVAPGLNGFRRFAGSGMPGVGVAPFGTLFAAFGSGIPGVVFADGGIGLVDSPSGKWLASTATLPLPTPETEFEFEFEFMELLEEHAATIDTFKRNKQMRFFDINKI